MGFKEISAKVKRTIRGINIKDTLGMHYYKLGAVGRAYWEIRLSEATDLEEAAYCRAQLEKCKIDAERKRIDKDPEIINLKEEKEKLLNELEALYKALDMSESEINQKAREIYKLINDIESKIQTKIAKITSELSARWDNLNFYYNSSEPTKSSFNSTISWKDIKNGNDKSVEKPQMESGTSDVLKDMPVSKMLSDEKQKIFGTVEDNSQEEKEQLMKKNQEKLEKDIEELKKMKRENQKPRNESKKIIENKKKRENLMTEMAKQEKELKEIAEITRTVERLVKNSTNIRKNAKSIKDTRNYLMSLEMLEKDMEKVRNDNSIIDSEKNKKLDELKNKIEETKEKLAKEIGKPKGKLKSVAEENEYLKNKEEVLFSQIDIAFDEKGNVQKMTPDQKAKMDEDKYLDMLGIIEKNKDGIIVTLKNRTDKLNENLEIKQKELETIPNVSEKDYNIADELLKALTKQEEYYDVQIKAKEEELKKIGKDTSVSNDFFENLKDMLKKQVESGAITIEDLQKVISGLENSKKDTQKSKDDDRSSI